MRVAVLVVGALFVGCVPSRVWLIERDAAGGTIGYQRGNYDDEEEFAEKLEAEKRKICGYGGGRVIGERREEESGVATRLTKVQNTSTTEARNNYGDRATSETTSEKTVPVTYSYTDVWYALMIACD
jgi:hypothetical protein